MTVDTVKSNLNNGLTKTWTLSKLYVNGTQTTLTAGQARYTKTYKADNTWLDSDGYLGTYALTNPQSLSEITTNYPGGARTITYAIKASTATSLDVEYTQGSTRILRKKIEKANPKIDDFKSFLRGCYSSGTV